MAEANGDAKKRGASAEDGAGNAPQPGPRAMATGRTAPPAAAVSFIVPIEELGWACGAGAVAAFSPLTEAGVPEAALRRAVPPLVCASFRAFVCYRLGVPLLLLCTIAIPLGVRWAVQGFGVGVLAGIIMAPLGAALLVLACVVRIYLPAYVTFEDSGPQAFDAALEEFNVKSRLKRTRRGKWECDTYELSGSAVGVTANSARGGADGGVFAVGGVVAAALPGGALAVPRGEVMRVTPGATRAGEYRFAGGGGVITSRLPARGADGAVAGCAEELGASPSLRVQYLPAAGALPTQVR